MTEEEFEKAMLHGERKIPFFTLLKRTLSYAKGDMWRIVLSLFVVTIGVVVDLLLPIIEKWFVDYLDAEHIQNAVLSVIIGAAIGFIAIALVNKIISYLMSLLLQKAGQNIVERLRMDVFSHIENMSQNQLNEMPVGSLVTRVANYTAAVSNLFTDVLVRFVMNMLTVLTVFVIMITLSWKLSLILLVFAVIVGVVSFFFVGVVASKYRAERKNTSILNSFLSENLQGMKIISIFNQQKKKQAQFDEDNENLRKSAYGINVAFTFYRPFMSFLYYGAIATTFGVGFALAFTPGLIVAFYLYLNRFFKPIQELADELNKIQSALTSSERLFNLLDVKPEVVDAEDAIEIDSFKGKIEFRNVWFAYEKDNWILRDVSFTVNPKETVAFVGATGAGKTTILSLIVRNYEIQKGQILIDDIDIAHIKVKSLRKAVGQMLQDVFLFSGTIKSNVSLRDESFDDKEIKEACEYVNASSFIEKLPKGYDEDVIEGGANFSSGQRQLLSFARTVLHKPQILILDEATANIDTETEMLIQSSLEKMKNIGTMLVVAHRLSTIQHADNIIVLQNGQIIEEGNHQSLLKKRGYYFKLYQLQFEH
ncbi:MAG: ABC transporter ATP-binding protein [Bacilli bacterium]|nr:ABC transporter ATP-binding protein [Bacilli bacterium]MBR3675389.1 ABC transporter ATP-binding protein [Bacilli bacterium]MBR6866330.1 ABC transporter ATP-binding protein [Bacilli bacterium]